MQWMQRMKQKQAPAILRIVHFARLSADHVLQRNARRQLVKFGADIMNPNANKLALS